MQAGGEAVLCPTGRVRDRMPRPRHTRRQALALGAAALALAGVRSRREAVAAAAGPDTFELPVPRRRGARRRAAAGGRPGSCARRGASTWPASAGRAAASVEVELRARRRGGRWTRWVALPGAGDHGPDAGSAHAGTEPAWTGPADELQLRLRGDARGLRVRCVQAAPGPRRIARAARAAAPRRGRVQAPAHHHARRVGRRRRAAAHRPGVRAGAARVRPPHGHRDGLRAGGLGGDGAWPSRATTATATAGTTWATTSSSTATARSSRAAPAASTRPSSARRRRAGTRSRPASPAWGRSRTWRRPRRGWTRSPASSAGS